MHYIYHIPGTKIGCTSQLQKRMRDQGFTEWEVLEEHEDGWLAGDREIELQKEYGLPVDTSHYMISVQNRSHSQSDKTKRKISEAQKGRVKSEEERANIARAKKGIPLSFEIWNKGKSTGPISDSHKQKISEAQKGRVKSEEERANLSKANKTTTDDLELLLLEDRKNGLTQEGLASKYGITRTKVRRIIKNGTKYIL